MNNYKVSIIIPVYNSFEFIQDTLKSIEDQTYKNYELVIINDGSIDGTADFLNKYKKDRDNIIVFHQENKGVSAARNKGIELANSELICFLDSDDIYHYQFLEKMIITLSNSNENLDAICCQCYQEEKNGNFKKLKLNNKVDINDLINSFYNGAFLHLSNLLIKKNFLIKNSILFDVEQKITEDTLFLSNLLLIGNVKAINAFLFTYKYRKTSTINTMNDEKNKNGIMGIKKLQILIENYGTLQNKTEIIPKLELIIIRSYISEYRNSLKNFDLNKAQKIKSLITKNKMFNEIDIHIKNKSEKRIIKYLKSNSYFKLFIGCIYYTYIRR